MNDETRTIPAPKPAYRLWSNDDRTVLVRLWSNGTAEFATRDDPSAVWGPPAPLTEAKFT